MTERENIGRVTKKSSVCPAEEVDCSTWSADTALALRTSGRFVKTSSVQAPVEVDCSAWGAEQRLFKEFQELAECFERSDTENLWSTIDRLKPPSRVMRILLKVVAKALRDCQTQQLIRELLVVVPTGKYLDIQEVERILQNGEQRDEDLCLRQLENYARRIVAQYRRDLEESKPG